MRRSARGAAGALLSALALLLAAPPGRAQAPEAAPAPPAAGARPAAPAPAKPVPIPGAEVADRAQEEEDRVRQIRERAAPEAAEGEIEAKLLASAEEVAGLAGSARERLAALPSRIELDRVSFDFARLRERLAGWSAALARRAESLDADVALLADREQVWRATREKAIADAQAGAVVSRIDKTIAAIERAQRKTRERRNQILTLRESIGRQQSSVDGILNLVEERRRERRRAYFALDRPPLWEELAEPVPAEGDLLNRMATARANDVEDLQAFAGDRGASLLMLGALTLACILGGVRLRRPALRLAEQDETFATAARVLERPASAGLLVGLLLGALLIPNPPPVVEGLGHFMLVVAALRLLVLLVDREFHPILYGLAATYVVDRLRDRLVPDLLASRLLLLALAMLGVAGLLWLMRPARLVKLGELARHRAPLRAIALGARLALLSSVVAILSNLAGSTELAELLVEGSLATALYAFIAFAISRALGGFWFLLLRSRAARSLRMVRNHEPLLRRRGRALIKLTVGVLWTWRSLHAFDLDDLVVASLGAALAARWTVGELTLSVGSFLGFALMIAASLLISRFVRFALEEDLLSRASLPRGVPFAISTLVRYAILLLGFAMALLAAGFEMSRLALMLGALGVGIGIGLQDIVNNVVSGLILLFERPVQVGDTVELGGVQGQVQRIGIRSSTVRTLDGAEVVLPNSMLVSESFVNWTLSDRQRRIEVPVGVAYGTDPERVLQLLERVVRARPEFLTDPPPIVIFDRFGESSLDFLVRAWAPDFDTSRTLQGQLLVDIHRALREAGIEIPFPQRDLHLRTVDRAASSALGGEVPKWPERPAAAPRRGS